MKSTLIIITLGMFTFVPSFAFADLDYGTLETNAPLGGNLAPASPADFFAALHAYDLHSQYGASTTSNQNSAFVSSNYFPNESSALHEPVATTTNNVVRDPSSSEALEGSATKEAESYGEVIGDQNNLQASVFAARSSRNSFVNNGGLLLVLLLLLGVIWMIRKLYLRKHLPRYYTQPHNRGYRYQQTPIY